MKIKEIREKSADELKKLLKDSQLKLGKLNFEKKSKPLKDNQEFKKTRRLIATIVGILSNKDKEQSNIK